MLKLRLEEVAVVIAFTVLHLALYHYGAQLPSKKPKGKPIFIEFIHFKPKPPEPKIEPPKPKLLESPPQPTKPPKAVERKKVVEPKVVKPKKEAKEPEVKKVVEKPRLQQESPIKVHAEEVVEKEVVEHSQPISEPVVKKMEDKPEEKAEPAEKPEPAHEPVITPLGGTGSCSSTLNHYPAEAREQGLEGTVKVKVQVSAEGNVVSASIVKSSGHSILDDSVLNNVRDCSFEPPEKDGVPFATKVIIPVRFRLD